MLPKGVIVQAKQFKGKDFWSVDRMKKEETKSECKGETGTSLMGFAHLVNLGLKR